ncbi:hypothetical protein GCM10023157_16240 [Gluconacetobacter asukensis]
MAIRNQLFEDGSQALHGAFISEMREHHLGIPNPNEGPLLSDRLQAAYDAVIAEAAAPSP